MDELLYLSFASHVSLHVSPVNVYTVIIIVYMHSLGWHAGVMRTGLQRPPKSLYSRSQNVVQSPTRPWNPSARDYRSSTLLLETINLSFNRCQPCENRKR